MWLLTSFASSTNRKRVAELPLDAPREVRRVDREAVAADSGTGREAHVPERLGRGRVDRRPDVDAEIAGEHRELVDERDVHVAERVLEELHELGFARSTRPARPCRRARRRTPRPPRATRRRHRTRPWASFTKVHSRVAGVDALGGVAEEEVRARGAARPPRGSVAAALRSCPGTSSTRGRRGRPACRRGRERRAPPASM